MFIRRRGGIRGGALNEETQALNGRIAILSIHNQIMGFIG